MPIRLLISVLAHASVIHRFPRPGPRDEAFNAVSRSQWLWINLWKLWIVPSLLQEAAR